MTENTKAPGDQAGSGKLRIIIKLLIFAALLFLLQRLLMPKYTGTVIEGNFTEEYYRDDTAHDLIVIGNCESYENISPMVLFEDFGITSYIRGNANQLIPQSYYILKETLRYETPKAVLLNIQAMTVAEQSTEEYNRMVFDSMRWSEEKLEGIKASRLSDEKLIEYIFPILRYKGRITELSSADFRYAFLPRPIQSYNGYYLRADIRPYDPEAYPYEEQIEAFAEERGLLYLNTLEHEEIGIDLSTDTYDGGLHLNVYGAEKVSRWLGPILSEECGLPDHRDDEELSRIYAEKLAAYEAEKESQELEFEELGYISKYRNEG